MAQHRRFAEYRDTPLWNTVSDALDELLQTREISIQTAPDYVIGYLCERLVTSRSVAADALRDVP